MPIRRLSLFIAMPALAVCVSAGAASVQVQVVDKAGKPMADAIVFLESPDAKVAAKPLKGVEMAQVAKQFVPAAIVVTPGTAVQFPNQDTVRHHVYSFSPAKTFDLKLYAGVPANPVVFDKAGIAVLGCNIHDNMVGWVLVVETPYFGRANADGKLVLDGVPAGTYRLRAWHPGLPVGAPASDQSLPVGNAPVTAMVKF